jgi:hypothetical protein
VWSKEDVTAMLINPVYAISIDPYLVGKHEGLRPTPMVSPDGSSPSRCSSACRRGKPHSIGLRLFRRDP